MFLGSSITIQSWPRIKMLAGLLFLQYNVIFCFLNRFSFLLLQINWLYLCKDEIQKKCLNEVKINNSFKSHTINYRALSVKKSGNFCNVSIVNFSFILHAI
jgi:hypothetical protein